ncbi:MAG: hypothetical protein U5M23_08745 [Marinagarivorans sp.]|nr:hypothetical protein [Marinagarivorans sp.]
MKRCWSVACVGALAGIVAALASAATIPASEDYDVLTKAYEAQMGAYRAKRAELAETEAYKEARAANDRDAVAKLFATIPAIDTAAWSERFWAGAQDHAGTDAAIEYLTWLVRHDTSKERIERVATIVTAHADSAAVLPFAESLAYLTRSLGAEAAVNACSALIARNENAEVLANAYFNRATIVKPISDAAKAAAEDVLAKVVELLPDSIPRCAPRHRSSSASGCRSAWLCPTSPAKTSTA